MLEMEENSSDLPEEEEENKDSPAIGLSDNSDNDNDSEPENVCNDLEANNLSSVVPNLMTSSGDMSDDTSSQPIVCDENMTHNQSVKIVKVVPLPHARSEVWTYFGFIADDEGEIQDKKKAICKICASTLAYSGNTTNLFTHLKAMHPEAQPQKLAPTNRTPRTGKKLGKRKADVLDSPSGPLIVRAITYSSHNEGLFDDEAHTDGPILSSKSQQNSFNSSASLTGAHNTFVATDEITNSIVNWLVKDCRPICVVEGKGFQELLRMVAPGYVIPDSRRLTTAVKKKYDEVRRDLILRAMQDE